MTTVEFPPRITLGQLPTPLYPLERISADLGGPKIWLKRDDLSGLLLTGNKVRKLEFLVAEALEQGCDTLITCGGIESNHCRATAMVAAQLGLEACLILREDTQPQLHHGNLFLDQLAGARVVTVAKQDYQKNLSSLFETWRDYYLNLGRRPFMIPTGGSDAVGLWGYLAACLELKEDFRKHNIQPSYIVAATGSGGTQAGLIAGAALYDLQAKILGIAVGDSEQYFQRKVRMDLDAWATRYEVPLDIDALAIETNAKYIGPGYGLADQEVYDTIRYVARREGIVFDPVYTGKAFFGLLQEIRSGALQDAEDIVFVHTGGLFGLFSHASKF